MLLDIGYPILDFQRRWMEHFAELLDRERAAMLRDDVLRGLYPGIMPDLANPEHAFDHLQMPIGRRGIASR